MSSLPYQLVADITVDTATTQVDFTGLNFGKNDNLMLVSEVYNSSVSGDSSVNIYVNANYTVTNYYSQLIAVVGNQVVGDRRNYPSIANLNIGERTTNITNIKLTNNGYFIAQSHQTRNYSSSLLLADFYVSSTFTITSITNLRIASVLSNVIGVGSRFQLYRLKAPIVADIIVSTATTQVDITGLNITKDSEYMLVSDVVSNGSYIGCYITANSNDTLTNYYKQHIWVYSSSTDAYRSNDSLLFICNTDTKSFGNSKIKLTNNGYFVAQNNSLLKVGTSSVDIFDTVITSTFTSTSITSIKIISSVTNGIGVDSRFQLIKLK